MVFRVVRQVAIVFALVARIQAAFMKENDDAILSAILIGGVNSKVYTGTAAIVGNLNEILFEQGVGYQTYDPTSTPVQLSTIFDLASVSKVVGTTSVVALLYQRGYLGLDTKIVDVLGSGFANGGKESVTVLSCLLHNAGFAPDPVPWYWDPLFACPNTDDEYPEEDFSCIDQIYNSFLKEVLVTPPGEAFVYSDLSFITLQMTVGTIVLKNHLLPETEQTNCQVTDTNNISPLQIVCGFEAFVRTEVFHRSLSTLGSKFKEEGLMMPDTMYVPPQKLWDRCMPTLNDTGSGSYTHKRLKGQVGDGDCYAMGGIAGHAGVFSTVQDLSNLAKYLLQQATAVAPLDAEPSSFLNATTVQLFSKVYNESQSSRALGWSTNSLVANDYGYDHSCGSMSPQTFMHTGYTGTCICLDPVNALYSVVLTNRAYNCQGQLCPSGSSDAVKAIYKEFNTEVVTMYGKK